MHAQTITDGGRSEPRPRAATAASAVVMAIEVIGSLLLWAPIPLAWMWIGARIFEATGSLSLVGAVVMLGFLGTTLLVMAGLNRLDGLWISLRRRAGHDQREGALNRVVVASATLGIAAFLFWYYVLTDAYIIPFMPYQ